MDGRAVAYGFRIAARVGIAAATGCLGVAQGIDWARFGSALAWPLSDSSVALRVVFDLLVAAAVIVACCATVADGRACAVLVAVATGLAGAAGIMITDLAQSSVHDIVPELAALGPGAWLSSAGLGILTISAVAAAVRPPAGPRGTDRPDARDGMPIPVLRPAVPPAGRSVPATVGGAQRSAAAR